MTDAIKLVLGSLDPKAVRQVLEVGEKLNRSVEPKDIGDVAVIVAGLPEGHRSIPVEAAELLESADCSTSLVLLSSEPLVRGHVVLAGGRVHLVAPPHDVESIRARLEHVLDGRPPAQGDCVPHRASHSSLVERWSDEYWMCALGGSDASAPDDVGKLLLAEKRADGCFAAFPSEAARSDPQILNDLVYQVERLMLGDDRPLGQWLADLSPLASVIAYDTEARELVGHMPPADECAAFLLSPHRVPRVSQLQAGTPVRVAASPGDILLVAVGEESVNLLDADEVRSIVQSGAVSGVRKLQQRFSEAQGRHALMVLEARE
ncbi:MAG: hypothetical protein AB8H80_11455 [Planctomycetota bacterium]